jgi:predicted MFS family arabinose efflux permease
MSTTSSSSGPTSPKIIFVMALLVAVFAAAVIDVILPINIVDIAATFGVLPGTVGQLNSIIAITSVVTALLLAAFGARFKYKTLVMIGVSFIAVCAIGLFLAPSFPMVQLIVLLNGAGSVLIVVTSQTFIGNSYPLEKKAKAIGWIAATGTLANAVGAPLVGFMTGIGSWRSSLIWFMLPTAVVSLIFVFLAFPYNPPEPQMNIKKEPFMKGFKQVLTNKSAVACLTSAFLGSAFVFGGVVFEVTFLRQVFLVSPSLAALVGTLVGTAFITVGALVGGQVVNRVGRKRLAVAASFLAGLFMLLSFFMQDLGIFLALRWTASFLVGILLAAASNLTLEQVPMLRGTTMSLASAFSGIGTALGVTLAGAVLNLYIDATMGFQALGLTIGVLASADALVLLFVAKEPIRTASF